MRQTGWYFETLRAYRKLDGAEAIRFADSFPQLHDNGNVHELDAHYFYANSWAARRIAARAPRVHVDVGSQAVFAGVLSGSVHTVYLDYRVFTSTIANLDPVSADIQRLPFRDNSIDSLSCVHVAEHIGLGRYGDPLNPHGTREAAKELSRVLSPGGVLYFAVPIGRERVEFNAHRIHAASTIRSYFQSLELAEYSGIGDDQSYRENLPLDALDSSQYACGLFRLTKP